MPGPYGSDQSEDQPSEERPDEALAGLVVRLILVRISHDVICYRITRC